mgnify:CR=1 FL=1
MTSTEREKIISLARECGILAIHADLRIISAFYKSAQNDAYEKFINEISGHLLVSDAIDAIRQLKEQS